MIRAAVALASLLVVVGCGTVEKSRPVARTKPPADDGSWIGLRQIARQYGYRYERSAGGRKHVLERPASRVEFDAESRVSYINGELVILDRLPRATTVDLLVPDDVVKHLTAAAPRPVARRTAPRKPAARRKPWASAPLRGLTIVVDAGHGGKDPGASRSGSREKNINLAVALETARQLKASGAEVVLTRRDDRFISLDGRVDVSNRVRPHAFISIHVNSAANDRASGCEVYRAARRLGGHRADKVPGSLRLAQLVYRRLATVTPVADRGVKPSPGFRVLKNNAHPAILVELGFVTNHDERRRLDSQPYQRRLAAAIAAGVRDFAAAARPVASN